jgi:hypothetical protein
MPHSAKGDTISQTLFKKNLQYPFFSRLYRESDFADEDFKASISATTAELFGALTRVKSVKK